MLISKHLQQYKEALLSLPNDMMLSKENLLVDELLMERKGTIEMFYAPHNEYINPSASVVIIGLTPGWTQMRIAIEEAVQALAAGLPDEEVCRRAKEAARFAGTMRSNLINMLNTLELHHQLNIASCEELFKDNLNQVLLHTTSLLRFPVFIKKKNYSGTHPNLISSPYLKEFALASIREELNILQHALIIPLGKTVERVLQLLVGEDKLDAKRCLWGFPHPSGANGHRHKQFAEHQDQMKRIISQIQTNPAQGYFG